MARIPDDEEPGDGERDGGQSGGSERGDHSKPRAGGDRKPDHGERDDRDDSRDHDGTRGAPAQSEGPKPGQMSELLKSLARGSEAASGVGWHAQLFPGAVFDRFELVRELGRGGFGVVWEAIDLKLGRRVAFKAVRTGNRAELEQERLQLEAETAARLDHPNVVTLFTTGQTVFGPYLILELLRGNTLAKRVADGPVPMKESLHILVEVARGIAHAHGKGVVHRDLKPANVFLCDDGRVKVLDLGLAHALGHVRPPGGTRGYMAPEQARGAPEDERSDVFALGVIAFRMLSGQLPFADERALRGSRVAPGLVLPDAPEFAELVASMLQMDAVRRPRDAREVLAALEGFRTTAIPVAPRAARIRRWPLLRLASLIAIGVVLGVMVAAIWIWFHPPPNSPDPRVVLAVADVDNQTGDGQLDGMAGMLTASLEQSPRLEVVPHGRLVDLSGPEAKRDRFRLDERAARVAGARAGASAVVVTTLRRVGELFVLELRVVGIDGRLRFPLRDQDRGKEKLIDLLDRVAEQLRLKLGEDPESVSVTSIALGRTLTRSPSAWDRYNRGQVCVERSGFATGFGPCLDELKRAVAIDPEFALAHLLISEVSYSEGLSRADQRAALEPALHLAQRIPPAQSSRIRGWAAFLDGKDLEAKVLLRQAAERSKDDKFAWKRAGEVPFHRDEFAEAVPLFREVHRLDPTWTESTEHLITALGCTGDLDGIREVAKELEAQGRNPRALAELCMARLWIDPARAISTCEDAVAAGIGRMGEEYLAIALINRDQQVRLKAQYATLAAGEEGVVSFGRYGQMQLATQEGRWEDALEMVKAGDASDNAWAHSGYVEALTGLGDSALVEREAIRTRELDSALVKHAAVHLAYLGDLKRAEEFAPFLPVSSPRLETYRAVVRWRRGDLVGAVTELQRVALGSPISVDPAVTHPLYLLGEALAELGRDAEAVTALERFLSIPLTYASWTRPRALYRLALSQERLGLTSKAAKSARRLREFWATATAEQPHIREARALMSRLAPR